MGEGADLLTLHVVSWGFIGEPEERVTISLGTGRPLLVLMTRATGPDLDAFKHLCLSLSIGEPVLLLFRHSHLVPLNPDKF